MKKNKYKAIKTEVDGITFDSKGEARRWCVLQLLEKAGEISDLKRQVAYELQINGVKVGKFTADFEYMENGQLITEDYKSPATAEGEAFRLRVKMFEATTGRKLRITSK